MACQQAVRRFSVQLRNGKATDGTRRTRETIIMIVTTTAGAAAAVLPGGEVLLAIRIAIGGAIVALILGTVLWLSERYLMK